MDRDPEAKDRKGTLSRRSFLARALAVSGLVVLEAGASSEAADSSRFPDPPGTIEAGFLARSYAPGRDGGAARSRPPARRLALQVMQAGQRAERARARDGRHAGERPAGRSPGTAAAESSRSGSTTGRPGSISSSCRTAHGKIGYAPFVVRPKTLGAARTLVVHPTNTWGAYNLRVRSDLVCELERPARRPHPPVPRRPAAALPRLRHGLHALVRPQRASGRHRLRRRPRGDAERRASCGGSTT